MKAPFRKELNLIWQAKELWLTTLLAAWATGTGLAYLLAGHLHGIVGIVLGVTTFMLWRRKVKRYLKQTVKEG